MKHYERHILMFRGAADLINARRMTRVKSWVRFPIGITLKKVFAVVLIVILIEKGTINHNYKE